MRFAQSELDLEIGLQSINTGVGGTRAALEEIVRRA